MNFEMIDSDHQSGGGYDNNRKNNFFVSIPRRNLDGHINRRGDSTYKNYLFQRSKYKYRNRRYNNYLDRSYSNSSSNYKRKRFYFHYEPNQEDSVNIKKEPNSMDDEKISSGSNTESKMLGIKREGPARRTRSNSTKTVDNKNADKSDVISDDDKTEENLEIDTTRSGASSKTVENLNTPLKNKSSLVKGIDEMSEDEKICNWLQNHQAANESLNNFSSISSYEDILSSPKRKIAEDFDSAYSDNDSDNLLLSKKSKTDSSETANNNNNSADKNATLSIRDLGDDESGKDTASNKNSKISHTSPSISSCNNTPKSASGGGKPASSKKYDIRNHKSIKMMQEIHSSISKFSNHIRKYPPSKTHDKPKECGPEKRKSTDFKRTTRSISLIEPKSPHQDRNRKSIDLIKKPSERRTKSRQSSVTSDRTAKSKYSKGRSPPPDKPSCPIEINRSSPDMPVISEKSKTLYNNEELLSLLESCASVDEKPIKLDESIIDITNDNDDNDILIGDTYKVAVDDHEIEVIEIDRDEKFVGTSNKSMEIEIIDMTTDSIDTSPKVEVVQIPETREEIPQLETPIITTEVSENSEMVKTSENINEIKVTDEIVTTANFTRNSSVIVDSRAISTPEKVSNQVPPTPPPLPELAPFEVEPNPESNEMQQPVTPAIEPIDVRSAIAIRVRDATSLGASEPITDEEAHIITVLNSEVFKSIIDICYLFCTWYAMLENYVQFSKPLHTEAGKMFNNNVSLILYENLKNLVFRSTYEKFESSITNYMLYSDDSKELLFKKMYTVVRSMCKISNTVMIPTSEPWIENIIKKCIDKFKSNNFIVENPVMPEGVLTNQIPAQHNMPQYIRTINGPGINRPNVPGIPAPQAASHPISPRQNVIEVNKTTAANPIQSLKDIRISNMNYHPGGGVSATTNPNIPVTLHQKQIPESQQYARRPELLNHLVSNGPISRVPVQHNKSSPQQAPSSHQYASAYPIAAKPPNPPATYIPNNSEQRFTVTAANTYYPPLQSNRIHQPPPYSSYVSYDPNSQYSHVQQQQYLNYQNQMRANHQQKQTTSQVPTTQSTVVNSPYSSILRTSLQPLAPIQPKPNSQAPQHTLHYPPSQYIPSQHGTLQQHSNQQSPPHYQRTPIQTLANATSNHPSQVRNHLRNHIEMSTQQHVQQQQQQQQQQQHQQQQQQQQPPNNLQKKPAQRPPQSQAPPGHPLQRPVATYEIVHNPSNSDVQYQLRLANDLSSQPPSNQVTSSQERISPDSQTTRDTIAPVAVGHGGGGGGGGGVGVGGGTGGVVVSGGGGVGGGAGGCGVSQQNLELSSMIKSLVRESLRELWPQIQQANQSEMANQITLNETKKMLARKMYNNVRNK